MKAYKFLTSSMCGMNGFQYEIGKKYNIENKWWLSNEENKDIPWKSKVYILPELAVLHNTYNYLRRMFEVDVSELTIDNPRYYNCSQLEIIKEVEVPELSNERKIQYALKCVKEIYDHKKFQTWSKNWIYGTDRSFKSASIEEEHEIYLHKDFSFCNTTLAKINTGFAVHLIILATLAYADNNYNDRNRYIHDKCQETTMVLSNPNCCMLKRVNI